MMPKPFSLLFALLVVACARDDDRWPSLAPRPAELAGLTAMQAGDPLPERSMAGPMPVAVALDPVAPRLAQAEHGLERARYDSAIDRAALVDAMTAARPSARSSDARDTVELQLTRLDATIAQFDDLARDLAAIARDADQDRATDPALRDRAHRASAQADADRDSLARLATQARDTLAR